MRRSLLPLFGATALMAAVAVLVWALPSDAGSARVLPPPALDEASGQATETAVLAGGCFWGVQGVFQHVEGVISAVSGYAGGTKETAQYGLVSAGATRHAEAVSITYDPRKISFGRVLQIFFSVVHDPTELNRQGPDVGRHYRSAIFPATDAQARVAKAYIEQLDQSKSFRSKIVTTIEAGQAFYRAEDYHQDYMTLHPRQPYIVMHDLPKVENLKRLFAEVYRVKPALVLRRD